MYFAEFVDKVYSLSACISQSMSTRFTHCLHVFRRVCRQGIPTVCMYFAEYVDKVYPLSVCISQSVSTRFTHCLYVFRRVCRHGLPTVSMYFAECVDKVDCRLYGQSACTGSYEHWAKDNCASYCGFCKGNVLLGHSHNMVTSRRGHYLWFLER